MQGVREGGGRRRRRRARGRDEDAGRVEVFERKVHAGPMEEVGFLAEVGRPAVLVDEVVRQGRHAQRVRHGDRAVDAAHESGVPGSHEARALLRDQRHGQLGCIGGRGVDGEADVVGEFSLDGSGEGL